MQKGIFSLGEKGKYEFKWARNLKNITIKQMRHSGTNNDELEIGICIVDGDTHILVAESEDACEVWMKHFGR